MLDVKRLLVVSFVYWYFFSGNYMWLGGYRWSSGYGAFSSYFKESDYCSLEFYYRLYVRGYYRARASLSVFVEQLTNNSTISLWSTSEHTTNWKKKVIKLPQTSYNYSIVFLGYFSSSIVLVDDMEFIRCNSCKLIHFTGQCVQ